MVQPSKQISPLLMVSSAAPVFVVRAEEQIQAPRDGLIDALRAAGFAAKSLRVLQLVGMSAEEVGSTLVRARDARYWLFSSPAAVRYLHDIDRATGIGLFGAQGPLARAARDGTLFAPGPGTAEALMEVGLAPVQMPRHRFDSEGLLALPALAAPLIGTLAIIGAPGGRGLLPRQLTARGADVVEVHVYRRHPAMPEPAQLAALDRAEVPVLIASSQSALQRLPAALPADMFVRLLEMAVVIVASERLASFARTLGFRGCHVAGSARTTDLVAAVRHLAAASGERSRKADPLA